MNFDAMSLVAYLRAQFLSDDCNYLRNVLYPSLSGPGWLNQTGWNDFNNGNCCSWSGVSCQAGTRVSAIVLERNNLGGRIPDDIFKLSYLAELHLSVSTIRGQIPPGLGRLQRLSVFRCSECQLQGEIPSELFDAPLVHVRQTFLKQLVIRGLQGNMLSGPLPAINLELAGDTQTMSGFKCELKDNNFSCRPPGFNTRCEGVQYLPQCQGTMNENIVNGTAATGSQKSTPTKMLSIGAIIGIVVGVLAVLCVAGFLVFRFKSRTTTIGPMKASHSPSSRTKLSSTGDQNLVIRAVETHVPQTDEEIFVYKGDELVVLDEVAGMLYGYNRSRNSQFKGVFPKDCVAKV
ncbi:hypothetical protein K493DRAFT_339378 [Basidiobolus meristosporus CBS 931.73]|uniref:SH3 domain-containing protein n=1 Tax=Basidiobolus meristosporus CBS 931.73 TaxID=1314790 RepID=A0A1Y1Y085_9FUNG|nr:hypothetical protein K493DRAFT_339378 [Basidiobolus meristosporus CBS 931.73]|eukprot:ORX91420.1 hypothetical protein K493DRAFT_339378 [Basidiobolus meristosporus CBS 931.73]